MRRLLCTLVGHRWGDWIRIPETMTLVSECGRCQEVRSVPYEPLVPDGFAEAALRHLARPNPYRQFARGVSRPSIPVEPPPHA